MNQASDFLERVGMTDVVIKWLARNEGNPLRERIITLFLNTINDSVYKDHEELLKKEISKIIL